MSNKPDSIKRVAKSKNFTVISNDIFKNESLSWKAKGILGYLMTLPDDWNFYISEVVKHSTDKEKSFRSGWKELVDHGYINRYPVREGRRIVGWDTEVYESPELNEKFMKEQNSLLSCFVHVEKEVLLNTNNKQNTNKEKDIKRYVQLELDVDNQYIQLYLSHYKIQFKRNHPKVSEEQYEEIVRCINIVKEELDNIKEYARGVVDHFDSLPKRNNGNILAFIKTFMRRYDIQTKEEWT